MKLFIVSVLLIVGMFFSVLNDQAKAASSGTVTVTVKIKQPAETNSLDHSLKKESIAAMAVSLKIIVQLYGSITQASSYIGYRITGAY